VGLEGKKFSKAEKGRALKLAKKFPDKKARPKKARKGKARKCFEQPACSFPARLGS
jgi:hypothetical protein